MEVINAPIEHTKTTANDAMLIRLESLRPPAKYTTGWGKEVYKLLCSTNTNNDGGLSNSELWECLAMMPIRIASLKPKPDKTNTIDPGAVETFDALNKADVDGDGCLEAHELITIVNTMRSAKKSASRLKKVVLVLSLLVLALLGCIGGIVGGVVFSATSVLPQSTSGMQSLDPANLAMRRHLQSSNGSVGDYSDPSLFQSTVPALTASSGGVLATTESLEAAPLYVAPVLPYEALRRVKIIDVKYKRGTHVVRTAMHVHAMNLISRTAVEFEGDGGRRVVVVNGTSVYQIVSAGGTPQNFVVCSADVQCSSLTVSVTELDMYVSEAIRELRAIGLDAVADAVANTDERRRQLWGNPFGKVTDFLSEAVDDFCDVAVKVFDEAVDFVNPPPETCAPLPFASYFAPMLISPAMPTFAPGTAGMQLRTVQKYRDQHHR